ncbi:MAG: ABC transporter substrate-binding protein [Nitrolancea sp.]
MSRQPMKICERVVFILSLTMLLAACNVPFVNSGSSSPTATSTAVGTPASQPQATETTSSSAPTSTTTAAAESPAQVVEGGTVEPRTLNPVLAGDEISDELSKLVFNGLALVDPSSGKIEGDLAKSWDVSEDRKTYTFHLKDGVTWQDGQPFTSQDVEFTYSLMMNDSTRSPRYSELVEHINEVQASDLNTVVFSLIRPDSAFLTNEATLGIVPQHVLSNVLPEELVTDPFGLTSTIGTGPFTLTKWSHGDELIFSRNPTYFKGPAVYDQYVYKIVATSQDLVSGLADGSIDWCQLDPSVVADAKKNDAIKVVSSAGDSLEYVVLQLDGSKQQLFLDANVRQALMLALDRSELVSEVWKGEARVATGTIPPDSWATADSSVSYAQNLDKAQQLLQDSGWNTGDDGIRSKNGQRLRFKLMTNGDNPVRQATANWLIQSWRGIGVDVVPDFEKWSTIVQDITHGREFDSLLLGYRGTVDPDQSTLWSSDSFFDGFNLGHYSNPDVDTLLEEARQSDNDNTRKADYQKVQDQVMSDLPALPLVYPNMVVGLSQRLRDVSVTTILIRNRANIEQWHPRTSG